jgi:immunoglobulin-binding protein 1
VGQVGSAKFPPYDVANYTLPLPMTSEPQNLRAAFAAAEVQKKTLEASYSSTSDPDYQNILQKLLEQYERCKRYVNELALFSPNESLEDISTDSLQYVNIYDSELTR